jgi:hypothetical protein
MRDQSSQLVSLGRRKKLNAVKNEGFSYGTGTVNSHEFKKHSKNDGVCYCTVTVNSHDKF